MRYLNTDNELCIMRLNTVQEFSDDSFFDYDMVNRVSHLTEYGVKNFGMPPTVGGMPESFAEKFILEEDRQGFYAMYDELYRTGKRVTASYRLRDGNGRLHWEEVVMQPGAEGLAVGYVRDISDKKQIELQMKLLEQLSVIESQLITSHKRNNSIGDALKDLAIFLQCEMAYIFRLTDDNHVRIQERYQSKQETIEDAIKRYTVDELMQIKRELQTGSPLMIDMDSICKYSKRLPVLKGLYDCGRVQKLYIIPVFEDGLTLIGDICLVNPRWPIMNDNFLKLIGLSFSRAYDNKVERDKIERLVSYDLSTNLLNRNKYLEYINHFSVAGIRTLCCVGVDVNGLHEYNNEHGHWAGDELLCCVANNMAARFDKHKVFRTGGDEFVAICIDADREQILNTIELLKEELSKLDIHISVGYEWRDRDFDIEEMLKSADKMMYRDKDAFYAARRSRR